jgi:hypothetical protein
VFTSSGVLVTGGTVAGGAAVVGASVVVVVGGSVVVVVVVVGASVVVVVGASVVVVVVVVLGAVVPTVSPLPFEPHAAIANVPNSTAVTASPRRVCAFDSSRRPTPPAPRRIGIGCSFRDGPKATGVGIGPGPKPPSLAQSARP